MTGVPASISAGPIQVMFIYCDPRGSPAPHSSSLMTSCSHADASRPPYSSGHDGVSRPRSGSPVVPGG
jgi:hypothetical protein